MPTGKPTRRRTGNEDGRCDYRGPGSDSGPCQGTPKPVGLPRRKVRFAWGLGRFGHSPNPRDCPKGKVKG
ncbi:hypothetical protein MBRA_19440 [Mycobacterium branderi]|uniref:Uncharacterized protein n=1 Tax=Mycobacterium branderi TaxID=43348 RepID=A0ABN6B5Q5_9MYCO|nr:hypothetical protein MBRA_19440 [Mycobacterium branderi]